MNEKELHKNEIEIDLQRLFGAVVKRAWLVILVSVLCAALTLAGTLCFITPKYEAKAMFYVNNNTASGDSSASISSGDLSTSRNLVESYLVILSTRESLNEVIDYAGVDRSYSELKRMISAAAVSETEFFQVTVTSPDPAEAEKIAAAIVSLLPERISSIIEGTSAKVVDTAVTPTKPSSPNYTVNTVLGFVIGFVLTVGLIVIREIVDITIRSEEDLAMLSRLPILAAVPDMKERSKKGGYHSGARKKTEKRHSRDEERELIGDRIPFAAAEAYKLLRTKVQFSFADDKDCHVIGVSSALAGEGKSTTSINLAYALAQLNKKVLLIDCDLRRPSIAAKLGMDQEHGLSSFLTKQSTIEQIMKQCRLRDNVYFMVVPAGPIPPNPTELLSSSRMEMFVNLYAQKIDYIILDLPPVEEVSDALVASKLAHGVLLAVRQNYCNRLVLEDTIRQFEFVKGRILGFLLTCATENSSGYGKSYYRRYYNRYGKYYKYARAYEESHIKNQDQA